MVATWQLALPQLQQLQDLNKQIVALANSYGQSGDTASAQAALQMWTSIWGQRMDVSTDPLVTQLVGLASFQRAALGAMDPNATYGADGQTVQNEVAQLTQQSTTIKNMAQQVDQLQATMSPQDWITYNERTKTFGEMKTRLKWLVVGNTGNNDNFLCGFHTHGHYFMRRDDRRR